MAYIVFKGFRRIKKQLALRKVKKFKLFGLDFENRNETYINKKEVLIFIGGPGTGKTKQMKKLLDKSIEVYGREGVFIPASESLNNWYKRANLESENLKGLSQFEKNQKLIDACNGKVIFIDDIDRLNSKVKIEVIKWLIRVACVVVVSYESEKKVNPSILYELRRKLKLKTGQEIDKRLIVDLGNSETEIKDIGLLVGLILVVFIALTYGFSEALIGALAFRWLAFEGKQSK